MKLGKSSYQPLKLWCATAVIVLALVGFAGFVTQQNYRLSANDPQIQMAHDAAEALAGGTTTAVLLDNMPTLDIAKSLAPFEIIYDQAGHELTATGKLDGAVPVLPGGVLDYAKAHGEDRITWQPRPGVREATVVVHQGQYYVAAARSLREVEAREDQLWLESAMAAGLLLVVSGLLIRFIKL
jgi:hypothetical protein